MSPLYRLDGRRLVGSLEEPTCNDTVTVESDDWVDLRERAAALARQGFTVWLFDHAHRPALTGASDLRLVERFLPARDPDDSAGSDR